MRNLPGRYGNAGNKHDTLDGFVLADVLRTDHRWLGPLERDTEPTGALRAWLSPVTRVPDHPAPQNSG